MDSRTLTAPDAAPPAARISNIRWFGLAVAIALGLLVVLFPTPAGLTVTGQRVLAVTAFTVCLWAFQVLDNGIAAILMMAMLIVAGVAPSEALSGFSDGSWWILTAVLFYGCAMKKTGLAQRISYYILSLFPVSYAGILSAFFMVGLVLALGVPSITVRTAIMVPIAWAAVQSLGIQPRSKGSALIILTTVEMAVIPGGGLLLSSLNGPVIQSAFAAKNLPLTYGEYAAVMALPSLVICVLIVIAGSRLKPESLSMSPAALRDEGIHAWAA
jgi:di/tricarboxylate transporter